MDFSPDGITLASGSWKEVRLWNARTGEHQQTLEGHTRSIDSVAFSPDGSTLASGSGDGTILLWNLTLDANGVETLAEDVNQDGAVNILDLVLVASQFGETVQSNADVNRDGVVNRQDLVLVAAAFGQPAAAPSMQDRIFDMLTAVDVQKWLIDAKSIEATDEGLKTGVDVLEQLLVILTESSAVPIETALLPNYPNPFNPETWIPYQLAVPARVTFTIYDMNGRAVRKLELGHQPAGVYESRRRAVCWDGRDEIGEPVAAGLYFYRLETDAFSATRRMVILK